MTILTSLLWGLLYAPRVCVKNCSSGKECLSLINTNALELSTIIVYSVAPRFTNSKRFTLSVLVVVNLGNKRKTEFYGHIYVKTGAFAWKWKCYKVGVAGVHSD